MVWQLSEFANGRLISRRELDHVVDGLPARLESIIPYVDQLASEEEIQAPIGKLVETVRQGPLAAGDSIALWGREAGKNWNGIDDGDGELQGNENQIRFREDRRLEWLTDGTLESTVWHDDSIALIPLRQGVDTLAISYQPSKDDRTYANIIRRRYFRTPRRVGPPSSHFARDLDLRAFVGENSGIIDTMVRLRHGFIHKAASATGVVVGKIVNLLSNRPRRLANDPLWARRRSHYENKFHIAAKRFPDIAKIPGPPQKASCIVAVHGTFSCGLNILSQFENETLSSDMLRFEHDTFINVTKNAHDLAELIIQKITAPRVLLLAHSRGGLVARLAAAEVQGRSDRFEVEVLTCGTPHQGTPLVHAGQRAFGSLYRLGYQVAAAIPAPWSVHAAMGYLLGPYDLPQGVLDMEPGRSFLDTIDSSTSKCSVTSYAGVFDPFVSPQSGYGLSFSRSFGRAAFSQDNDLVVPTSSAEAIKPSHRVADCDHFSYFAQPALRNKIINWK